MDVLTHPIFDVLQPLLQACQMPASLAQLNQLAASQLSRKLQFIAQQAEMDTSSRGYEQYIYEQRQIPTRENSWHDSLNALIWLTFPQLKECLNQLQIEDFVFNSSKNRTNRQNLLAHVDECGLIILIADENIYQAIVTHQWHDLFVSQREVYGSIWKIWPFGHGLLESMLQPFIGLTGKAILVKVSNHFFAMAQKEQIRQMDIFLAESLRSNTDLIQKSRLQPIPLLGVPGWYPNQTSDFYANLAYFRPKPEKAKPVIGLRF